MLKISYGPHPEQHVRHDVVELSLASKLVYVWDGPRDEPSNGGHLARFRDRVWRLSDGTPGNVKTTTQLVISDESGRPLEIHAGNEKLAIADYLILYAWEGTGELRPAEGVGGSGKPYGVQSPLLFLDRSGSWHSDNGQLEHSVEIAASEFFTSLPYVAPAGQLLRPSALSAS